MVMKLVGEVLGAIALFVASQILLWLLWELFTVSP